MNNHHIQKIFRDSPAGDQIKFEICLEKWKLSLNIPNQSDSSSSYIANVKSNELVSKIINSTKSGHLLLKNYNENYCFNEQQRNLLVNIIANYIHENGLEFTVSDCSDLEEQIFAIFSNEKKVRIFFFF